jgi:hypothetical protein
MNQSAAVNSATRASECERFAVYDHGEDHEIHQISACRVCAADIKRNQDTAEILVGRLVHADQSLGQSPANNRENFAIGPGLCFGVLASQRLEEK